MSETENTTTTTPEATPEVSNNTSEQPKATDQKNKRDNRRGGRRGGRDRKPREPKEFEETILQIQRVTRVTAGGRQMRFKVSVAIGDKKGRVGFGMGKSSEVMTGVQKAIAVAKKNLVRVPIFEDTIPHAIKSTFKSSTVLLMPAPEGKGVIAGGAVRKILDLAGIKNVLSKSHGSRNKINVAFATLEALQSLQNRAPIGTKPEAKEETNEETKQTEKPAAKKKAPAKKADK